MIEFRVNLPDFNAQLRALSLELQRKTVLAAVRAAGGEFRAVARTRAPILVQKTKSRTPGSLRRNIYVGKPRRQPQGAVRVVVSVRSGRKNQRNGDPFYWKFLEGGWIPRGPGNRIRGGKRRVALERRRLAHRKVSYPFLRPAFDSARGPALAAFNRKMNETIARFSRAKVLA